jgi:membrane fusion protein, cation efflux system
MKPFPFASAVLAVSLSISVPSAALAHVGHGDEFQATGGINRVEVKAETDALLGIVVTPIATAAGSPAVMIPATALVDADGKQLVFVQYKNFYEPVPIQTGATKGDLVEVTQGLSVGEKLVTQGSLSLYAESRKTQTATASPSPSAIAASPAANHAQADAQGLPHSHDASGNMAQAPAAAAQPSSSFPMSILAAIGGGTALVGGAIAAMAIGRKQKSAASNKNDGGF